MSSRRERKDPDYGRPELDQQRVAVDCQEGESLREIAISHFTITRSPCVAKILGLPEMPIQRLRISDLVASTEQGFSCERVDGLELHDVRIETKKGSALTVADCRSVELEGLQSPHPVPRQPVVCLENVEDACLYGCKAWAGTGEFLEVRGERSREIRLMANRFSTARKAFVLRDGVSKDSVLEK